MKPPDAPIAQTIHDGSGRLPVWHRELIAEWLTAHGIRPKDVSADHPILILNMPYRDRTDEGSSEGLWAIQVIWFVQYIRNEEDNIASHPGTGRPLTIQRTVPLQHAFPADPATDGEDHGEADQQAAEEAPQVEVRPPGNASVSNRHEGQSPQRPGQGSAERIEDDPEDDPGQGHEAVAQPEEDGPEEEVGHP